MLSFVEAINIFRSYPHLEERVSGRKHSFHLIRSNQRSKEIAREIVCSKNGAFNGYVHARDMTPSIKQKYSEDIDDRQMIKIKSYTEEKLHEVIRDAIHSVKGSTSLPVYKEIEMEQKKITPSQVQVCNKNTFEELVRSNLYNWLGYGNPNGPVWFIGTEEGGAEIWRQQTKSLEESLRIRSTFNLHMDFQEVWENKYRIPFSTFRGANVWNFIAAFLLNLDGKETTPSSIRSYVFQDKLLGRSNSNHYLCELYPLPKPSKNVIDPYGDIWKSITAYHDELKQNRLDLISDTISNQPNAQIMVAFERSMVDLFHKGFSDKINELEKWQYKNQHYSLYQIELSPGRSILFLSTPFFGQGQISYDGITDCVQRIKVYL